MIIHQPLLAGYRSHQTSRGYFVDLSRNTAGVFMHYVDGSRGKYLACSFRCLKMTSHIGDGFRTFKRMQMKSNVDAVCANLKVYQHAS